LRSSLGMDGLHSPIRKLQVMISASNATETWS
jgi:hypothetical protein